jgi:hypothetical protein
MPRHTRRHARRKSTVRRRRASRTSKALRRRLLGGGGEEELYTNPDPRQTETQRIKGFQHQSGLSLMGMERQLGEEERGKIREHAGKLEGSMSPFDALKQAHMESVKRLTKNPFLEKGGLLMPGKQASFNAKVRRFTAKQNAKRAAQNAALERYIAYSGPAKGASKSNNGSAAAGAGAGAGAVAAPVAKTAKNIAKSTSNALFALNAKRRRAAPVAINPDDVSKSLERLTIEFSDLMAYGEGLVNDGHNSQAAELEPYAMRIDAALKAAKKAMDDDDVETAFQQVSQASTAMGGASVVAASFHKNLS